MKSKRRRREAWCETGALARLGPMVACAVKVGEGGSRP